MEFYMDPASGFFLLMSMGEIIKEDKQTQFIQHLDTKIQNQYERVLDIEADLIVTNSWIDDLVKKDKKQTEQIKKLDQYLIVLNVYIDKLEEESMEMREQIKILENNIIKLASSHSAVAARDKVETERLQDNDEFLDMYIQRVENKTITLEEMMSIYHP